MRLRTRLTERFDIEHPIISVPTGMVAGGSWRPRCTMAAPRSDPVRNYHLPSDFSGRALRNGFVTRWHGLEDVLTASSNIASETEPYWAAFTSGDADNAGVFMGEAAGLIHDIQPAAQILEQMVTQAHGLLHHAGMFARS